MNYSLNAGTMQARAETVEAIRFFANSVSLLDGWRLRTCISCFHDAENSLSNVIIIMLMVYANGNQLHDLTGSTPDAHFFQHAYTLTVAGDFLHTYEICVASCSSRVLLGLVRQDSAWCGKFRDFACKLPCLCTKLITMCS